MPRSPAHRSGAGKRARAAAGGARARAARAAATGPIVVKLGGSLAQDPALACWLRQLAGDSTQRFVVVPGGGPFAEAVRAAQGVWHFSDAAAHTLAIAAMDQLGRVVCEVEPRCVPCSTRSQIEQAWAQTRLPVWLPSRMMGRNRTLARNWDVTSDTIAARNSPRSVCCW